MNKFRKWLIEKLGGTVQFVPREDQWTLFKSDYWNEKCVHSRIYIPKELYNDDTVSDIERELATNIGKEMLNNGLLFFTDTTVGDDTDSIQVFCQANALTLKVRSDSHMPSRLSEVLERRRRMNEQNRTR